MNVAMKAIQPLETSLAVAWIAPRSCCLHGGQQPLILARPHQQTTCTACMSNFVRSQNFNLRPFYKCNVISEQNQVEEHSEHH